MTHPLHDNRLCHPKDLGAPIPESAHAVSVCLPEWADIVGYEENDPRVIDRMRAGYPRFFFHARIQEMRKRLRELHGRAGEEALPLSDETSARDCAQFLGEGARAVEIGGRVWAAFFPEALMARAKAYWQHAGRILSSRAAEDWLTEGRLKAPDFELETVVRTRLSDWSGAPLEFTSLHPSGMAAIYSAFLAARERRPDRRMVMFGFPYTDTLKILQKFGTGTEFYPNGDEEDLQKLRNLLGHEEIAGIFCEFPSNPLLRVPDVSALHRMAATTGTPLIVDDTIATFYNVEILPFVDLVASSLTKAFSGGGDVMAGALTVNPQGLFGGLRNAVGENGGGLYVRDLQVLERNSRDFGERMQVTNRNSLALARLLAAHPAIEKVYYPGLESPAVYESLRKPEGGYGAVFSFLPKDAPKNSRRIFENLSINRGISFGTSFSLVCPYVQLAHYHELDWVQSCGVDPFLLRVGVGTEPWAALEECFTRALAHGGR
ncbi:MAG: PLP-dependent transferase [Chthoniobacterales bacterium]|nr:PLP-dependent transferase [Chthoniobacterales bacterium]